MTQPLPRRAVLAGGLCLCCAPRPGAAAAAPFVQIAPGLHIRQGLMADAATGNADAIANIGFIVGERAVAVFDPGGSLADGQALRQAIARTTRLPIRHVILSHIHPDHIFGAAAFLPDHPSFIGHVRLPAALAARGLTYQTALDRVLGPGHAGPVVAPTRLIATEAVLDLGNRPVTLTAHANAHTTCDLTALDHRTGTLLAGDLLFVGRVPALDGSLAGWRAELAALTRLPARQAVPGHGPPRVAWPAAANDLARYLALLQTETRAAIARAVPIERAATEVARSERPHWQLFDDYNSRNVLEAYHEIEWE